MDIIDHLRNLGARAEKIRGSIQTEEATKTSLVMPFLASLGYDVFDPTEVIPEYGADVSQMGIKKGEKVDYAVCKEGKLIMLFECKKVGTKLENEHASQLLRYFNATSARVAILTDGVIYRFFSDLEDQNKMDKYPFLEFSLLDIQESVVAELKNFAKSAFDVAQIMVMAAELKYNKEVKRILTEQLLNPSEDFIKYFVKQMYTGPATAKVVDQFRDIIKKSINQFINDRINERLKHAMTGEVIVVEKPELQSSVEEAAKVEQSNGEPQIVTTMEEIEAYYIVKSILHGTLDVARVVMRDNLSYCGILLDDNNRKPICRFYFNTKKKSVGMFDQEKKETKYPIEALGDIYNLSEQLKAVIALYIGSTTNSVANV